MPKISVIVPVYNVEKYIKECIESILNQSLSDFELLLIDDIGAETTTAWGRDEVLGTILQYRMQEGLITFFTSNFNISELEEHFSFSKNELYDIKYRFIRKCDSWD